MIHASTVADLVNFIQTFFEVYLRYDLKLNPQKCVFFSSKICWRVHVINHEGACFDTRHIGEIQ